MSKYNDFFNNKNLLCSSISENVQECTFVFNIWYLNNTMLLLYYFSVTFVGNCVTLFSLLFSCSFISTHYLYMYINIDKYFVVSVTYLNLSLNNFLFAYFMPHVTVAYFPFSDVPIKLTLDGSNVHASIVHSNNLFPKYVVITHN